MQVLELDLLCVKVSLAKSLQSPCIQVAIADGIQSSAWGACTATQLDCSLTPQGRPEGRRTPEVNWLSLVSSLGHRAL